MNGFNARVAKSAVQTKRQSFSRLMMTSALVAVGTLSGISTGHAADYTLPSGGSVVAGATNPFDTSVVGKLGITQTTDRVVINWDSFNIGTDATVQFYQPNSGSLAVNRVLSAGTDPTRILGTLKANGQIMVLDRNGVLFGSGPTLDVGGLVASTGDIDIASVMNGDRVLTLKNFGTGEIINEGTISAADSGLVAFVGPVVKNNGIINAKLGHVSLAAGNETATVDLYGDGLVELAYTDKNDALLSENTGTINAVGGTVLMSAAAAKDVVDSVVNMNGVAHANSATVTNGKIILSAKTVKVGHSADVKGSTKIAATTADLDATIDGAVTGSAKTVNVKSDNAKIKQGLDIIDENGTINVAAGTYNEHLVVIKNGVTLKGAKAGVSGLDASRGTDETIVIPNSPGITIGGDNVTVDGLSFTGAIGANGYGIFVDGGDYATLKNNIIDDVSQFGVYLLNSLGSVVSGNAINNTGNHGIYAVGSAGTEILNNNIGTLSGNNNINGDGVLLETSNGSVVKGNTITETKMTAGEIGSGVHILNSSNVTVGGTLAGDKNTISNAEWDAVKVTNGSNILVEGNNFDNLTRVGVFAKNTNGIVVRGNDIDNAKMYGVQYTDVKGVSSIAGNTIDTVGIDGVYIYFSNNVAVTDNVIGYGADGAVNTGDDTVIGRDGISSVYSAGTNISGNDVANTKRNGIYVQGKSGVVVAGNTVDFTGKTGVYLLGTLNAKVQNNKIGTVGVNNNINGDGVLVETSNGTSVTGNTITKTKSTASEVGNGVHVLNSDNVIVGTGSVGSDRNFISNAEWDGVKITNGKNVTVEGNKIETVKRVGVYARATNGITVRSNDIDDAKMYGAQLQDVIGTSSVVSNSIDKIGIDGINLYFSTNVKVTDNVIGYGLDGLFSTPDDAAATIGRDGISSVYSAGSDISGNKVANTKRNGINVEGKSGVKLTSNTVNNTGKSGVYLLNTTDTKITGNQIGTLGGNNNINGDGILVQTSNGVVIKGNTITKTKSTASEVGSGVHLLNSNDAIVGGPLSGDKNTISNAEWDAVKITNGSNILVEGNDFDNLKRVGVYALNTNGLNILNNNIDVGQMYGVQVDGVTGVTNIIGNTIDKVGFDGISVRYGAKNVNIQNNVIGYGADSSLGTADDKNSGRDGISVVYSTGTNIENNFITNTSRHGVYAQAAAGTNVIGNTINKVVVDGVNLVSASNSTVNGNTIGYGADGFANTSDDTIIGRDGVRVENSATIYIDNNNIANAVANGIHSINGSDFLQINGNTIDNSGDNGIIVEGFASTPIVVFAKSLLSGGLFVNNNTITHSSDNGIEIVGASGTVQISGNNITDSGLNGIYVHNYTNYFKSLSLLGSGDLVLDISGNAITGSNIGVNLTSINGDLNVTNNIITNSNYDGVYVENATGNVEINNNNIDNSVSNGIELNNVGGLVTIDSNHISNSGYNGVLAYNYSSPVISDVQGREGFYVQGNYYASTPISLHIVNNTIENIGSGNGEGGNQQQKIANITPFGFAAVNVDVSGDGYVELSGNTLGNNFEYGLVAYSGTIDLTGATNTIHDTTIGMGFYPTNGAPESDSQEYFNYLASQLSLVKDTIGTIAFIDQSKLFVDLGYGAMFAPGTPTQLDGNNATYTLGGVAIDPATNGGVTQAEYDVLESMINHYNDTADRGQFFFNILPPVSAARTIDQKDVLRDFVITFSDLNGGSLTITGLPSIGGPAGAPPAPTGGAFNPNAIEPAAGDEAGAAPTTTGDIAAVEPAAGGENASCWEDATASLGQGTPVTFNFGAGSSALLQDAASCGNGQAPAQGQSL